MREFRFKCPHCEQSLEAPPDLLGQIIACPSCEGSIEIPQAESATGEPESPPGIEPAPSNRLKDCPFCGDSVARM